MSKDVNQNEIQQLLKNVEQKKAAIAKNKVKISWNTNCRFKYDTTSSTAINLNTVRETNTVVSMYAHILEKETAHIKACKALKVKCNFMYDGYVAADWFNDFKQLSDKMLYEKDVLHLKMLETRLSSLVSKSKKDNIELDEIKKLLKM